MCSDEPSVNRGNAMKPVLWSQATPSQIERVLGRTYDTRRCLTCDQVIQAAEMDWLDYWDNGPYHKTCPRHPMVLGVGKSQRGDRTVLKDGVVYVSVKRAAGMLGIGRSEINDLIETGKLADTHRTTRSWYVAMDAVTELGGVLGEDASD